MLPESQIVDKTGVNTRFIELEVCCNLEQYEKCYNVNYDQSDIAENNTQQPQQLFVHITSSHVILQNTKSYKK